jgi:hypothetical protein
LVADVPLADRSSEDRPYKIRRREHGLPHGHAAGHDAKILEHVRGHDLEQVAGHVLGRRVPGEEKIFRGLGLPDGGERRRVLLPEDEGVVSVLVEPAQQPPPGAEPEAADERDGVSDQRSHGWRSAGRSE